MFKRIIYTLVGATAVCTLLFTAAASAQNPIWCGLLSGSNFSLSGSCGSSAPATTPQPANTRYVALGDSVAAGLGLPAISGDDARCGRSALAYPALVAANLKLSLTNVACSGATA